MIKEQEVGIMIDEHRAISGALNPNTREAANHAKVYYEEIRKRTSDYKAIARNMGWSEESILKIKEHIFINKYDLGGLTPERFYPDYHMAVSWQRLIDGTDIKEMDLVLLKHEYMELALMNFKGLSYRAAHDLANSKHNYSKHIK